LAHSYELITLLLCFPPKAIEPKYPITGIVGCCARAACGHPAAPFEERVGAYDTWY
jgi:hypothetical protein